MEMQIETSHLPIPISILQQEALCFFIKPEIWGAGPIDVIKMVVDQQVDGEVHKVAVEVIKLSHLLSFPNLFTQFKSLQNQYETGAPWYTQDNYLQEMAVEFLFICLPL